MGHSKVQRCHSWGPQIDNHTRRHLKRSRQRNYAERIYLTGENTERLSHQQQQYLGHKYSDHHPSDDRKELSPTLNKQHKYVTPSYPCLL